MFAPTRLFLSLRLRAPTGIVAGAAFVAVFFAATPFLLPEIADRYEVSLGSAGLVSAVQVSGFAIATFVGGRWLVPRRAYAVVAGGALVALNALSAVNGSFALLLALRLGAGLAAGMLVWLAWVDAMADRRVMRDVAATGPLTVLVLAPGLGWLAGVGGDPAVYWALAAAAIPVTVLPVRFEVDRLPGRRRMSPSRSNVVLLIALGLLTLFGSSMFVFAAAVGSELVGMSDVIVALAFSVNAGAGFLGARWGRRGRFASPWLLAIAGSVAAMVFFPHPIVFWGAMTVWGFAFWMAVPTLLGGIAEWSLAPDERVGDAQSVMAVGRALGPALGGLVLGISATFEPLGAVAGLGLVVATVIVAGVERYRRDREPRLGESWVMETPAT